MCSLHVGKSHQVVIRPQWRAGGGSSEKAQVVTVELVLPWRKGPRKGRSQGAEGVFYKPFVIPVFLSRLVSFDGLYCRQETDRPSRGGNDKSKGTWWLRGCNFSSHSEYVSRRSEASISLVMARHETLMPEGNATKCIDTKEMFMRIRRS